MQRLRLAVLGGAVVLALAACGGRNGPRAAVPRPPEEIRIWSGNWILRAFGGKDGQVLAGSRITARFEGGATPRVSGSAGCNRYFAGVRLEGDSLSIGPAGVTRMMCSQPEGVMEQEARYLEALQAVAGHRIAAGQLALLDGAGRPLLVFAEDRAP